MNEFNLIITVVLTALLTYLGVTKEILYDTQIISVILVLILNRLIAISYKL